MEHIKVAVISFTPNMLDLLLAKDRGFYSAQGLEVEWVPLAGEKGIRGLLEGKVDFSIQIAAALKLVMTENAGLKIALIIHRDPPHWMMGRPGFTIEQLRGKTVGSGGRGSDSALLVEAWLEKAGLEPGVDVSVSYHGAQPSWARGWFRMTDDVPMAIPLEREILEARGWAPLVELCTLFPGLLNHGLVVTEQVFNLNGLGKLFVESVLTNDFTLTQQLVMLVVAIFVFMNFMVDIFYAWLDPRIRYA